MSVYRQTLNTGATSEKKHKMTNLGGLFVPRCGEVVEGDGNFLSLPWSRVRQAL